MAAQKPEVGPDRVGRRGDRLVGRVGLHDAAQQVEDVNEGLLALRPGLGIERVHEQRLDGAEDVPQLLFYRGLERRRGPPATRPVTIDVDRAPDGERDRITG